MAVKIKTLLVWEMLGRPAEHISKIMEDLINKIGSEKGISIVSKTIHPTKKIENKDEEGNLIAEGELYSIFSEVEIDFDNTGDLIKTLFIYMPAHIEILEPEDMGITNLDMNMIANTILAKMHHYDSIAKSALMNNQALANKIKEIMQTHGSSMIKPPQISYGKADENHTETGISPTSSPSSNKPQKETKPKKNSKKK